MITHQRLIELLDYDPESGIFRWRVARGCKPAQSVAGYRERRGYIMIKIDGAIPQYAHRLAFLYVTGRWPIEVDHRDLDRSNNRWSNLREAQTHSANLANQQGKGPYSKGVRKTSAGRFASRLTNMGKTLYLGTFDNPEEAHAAYVAKANEIYGEFARAE